ncbi:tetratricopeptide repeat protein, partial [bacterium]|nr:tetratricopeptide repeat protein [bacterium]
MDFRNLTGEREIAWLSIGIAETLTHKLKEIGELEVVEQSEIRKVLEQLRMRMETGLYEKVARILDVDLLVVGAFQISGDEIRITVRMVEIETGRVLKSTMATGNLSDIFKLQDQLTFATADTLEIRVKTKVKKRIMRKPTDKLSAYKWFSKGCDYDDHVATYDQALFSYQKALKIDPGYADAYNNLGVLYYKKGRYQEATEKLRKAIEITPDYPKARFLEKSISELEREIEKRPDDIHAHWELAFRYQKRGYHGLAALEFREVIRINPRITEAHYQLGNYYLSIGREREAIGEYEEALTLKSK